MKDYLHVHTCTCPEDDTVTLATIQRFVERVGAVDASRGNWSVRTLIEAKPMTREEAMGLATCYAERKHIPLVVTEGAEQ